VYAAVQSADLMHFMSGLNVTAVGDVGRRRIGQRL